MPEYQDMEITHFDAHGNDLLTYDIYDIVVKALDKPFSKFTKKDMSTLKWLLLREDYKEN
jgi:hypothetical protein